MVFTDAGIASLQMNAGIAFPGGSVGAGTKKRVAENFSGASHGVFFVRAEKYLLQLLFVKCPGNDLHIFFQPDRAIMLAGNLHIRAADMDAETLAQLQFLRHLFKCFNDLTLENGIAFQKIIDPGHHRPRWNALHAKISPAVMWYNPIGIFFFGTTSFGKIDLFDFAGGGLVEKIFPGVAGVEDFIRLIVWCRIALPVHQRSAAVFFRQHQMSDREEENAEEPRLIFSLHNVNFVQRRFFSYMTAQIQSDQSPEQIVNDRISAVIFFDVYRLSCNYFSSDSIETPRNILFDDLCRDSRQDHAGFLETSGDDGSGTANGIITDLRSLQNGDILRNPDMVSDTNILRWIDSPAVAIQNRMTVSGTHVSVGGKHAGFSDDDFASFNTVQLAAAGENCVPADTNMIVIIFQPERQILQVTILIDFDLIFIAVDEDTEIVDALGSPDFYDILCPVYVNAAVFQHAFNSNLITRHTPEFVSAEETPVP